MSEPENKGSDDKTELCNIWDKMDGKRSTILNRTEQYAMWTLPHVFPVKNSEEAEQQGPLDSTGARAVNHLSNKLVTTLFNPNSPFFRLMVTDEMLSAMRVDAELGDGDAAQVVSVVDKQLAAAERDAMRELDMNTYRTEATNATKSLIVTGNSMLYHPEGGKTQCYNFRDFVVSRDLNGTVVEFMTRDTKAFGTFSKEVQEQLKNAPQGSHYKSDTEVKLYTHVKLSAESGKYEMTQSADKIKLNSSATWTSEDLPYVILTWNLNRGENYGRGLVEDYAGAFHALYTLAKAEVSVVAIAADIKFLVDPSSVIDVKALNDAESGTYHSGKPEDVQAMQLNKAVDMQMVEMAIERYQHQIAAAFLLNSGVTRQAERVTAEEIRVVANELEMAHAGIYSRFAVEWQHRTATLMLRRINLDLGDGTIYPVIITGLDSLSREGDLDNLRRFMADLAMLDGVPEEMRAIIHPKRFAQYLAIRHRVMDYESFLKTGAEIQAEQQQEMQQQQAMMQAQAGANVAQAAGEAAAQTGE